MPSPSELLLTKLVAIASKEVGVREAGGNNRGARIEEYQQATWLNPAPWPWCAAFTAWCLRKWLQEPQVMAALKLRDNVAAQEWRCRDASAFGWEKWARARKLPVLDEAQPAKPGDIVIFDFSHIGIVSGKSGKSITTVEGNTNGKGERDSVSGDGVWTKSRKVELVKCYVRLLP